MQINNIKESDLIDNNVMYANEDKHKIDEQEKKVLRTIYDIAWRNKSFYRELFYFHPEKLTFKQLQKKALFKINNIMDFECRKEPFSVKIFAEKDEREKSSEKIKNNDSFLIKLKINFYNKDLVVRTFKASLLWINKAIMNLEFKKFNAVDEAIKKMSKINKNSFDRFRNGKQSHLFHFLQGLLLNISPEFEIEYMGDDITANLMETYASRFRIKFQKNDAFTVDFEKDEVKFYKKDRDPQRWTVNKPPTTNYTTNVEKTLDKWKITAKLLRINFKNLWDQTDTLYELIRSVNHIFEMLYKEKFADAIKVTTSFSPRTPLAKLYYDKVFNGQVQNGLNFQWFLTSYNFEKEIFNMDFNTVEINYNKIKLVEVAFNSVTKIDLNKNSPIKTNNDLYTLISFLFNKVSYQFEIDPQYMYLNANLRSKNFITEVLYENQFLKRIWINWSKETWNLDNKRNHVKDEL